MEDDDVVPFGQTIEVVDPDVRAHVYSLVTALGGFNGEDVDRYVLGDDALACLRDIKRWLKLYDEKSNRMDVARCLGESNLVNGDLLPILSLWWTSGQNSRYLSRIALACLELLVPLTWPVEFHGQMTVNHHRHIPYIQQAQVQYKRGILSHANATLLRTIIRIGLPSMAIPRSERSTRDEGILKLMLYLIRNISTISPDTRLVAEGEEEATSRSATVNALQAQDAFALLLTMCSNVGDDFSLQDVVLLEILFHIVKGVEVEKLFMDDAQRKAKRTDELDGLLRKESSLRREYAKTAPTRHGRFGTMIWVKRDDAKVSTVSGQDVLKDQQVTLQKMDQSKKWNKPRPRRKNEDTSVNNDFNTPVQLSSSATANLRKFVEEFLDSGFNVLFTHVRKAIEREADRVMDINSRQYFYTVAWFLQAERVRRLRQLQRAQNENAKKVFEPDSFGLVAGVLNQETFVFLNRSMQYSYDHKDWEDLNAEMRCFTQILLTVQEMAQSPLEEDQEIAENIQNRIFYEETTHDRILAIFRGYKGQGFGYLDACTELAHVFLRMLERYSKENLDMHIRSRRRSRRKNKKAERAAGDDNGVENDEQGSEDEDREEAERVSKERKFDFKRFASKFCNQNCVDTFFAFTQFYKELNTEQLKRAHRYFYRIAFKQEMSVLLFRVDIINLFYKMIKGPGGLDSSNPIFREWEELVRQLIRRLVKKLDQRPALITEMLFSKINSTMLYLEYGHERQTLSTAKRPPAELEIDSTEATTTEAKLEIVVAALIRDGQSELLKWISEILGSAAEERESWEAHEEARRAESPEVSSVPNPMISVKARDESGKQQMFSNAKLRLLMVLVGFERLGVEDVPGASWVVPSALGSKALRYIKSVIDNCLEKPFAEDNERDPRDLLRRKDIGDVYEEGHRALADVNFGSDSEGEEVPDGPLFPPNPRSKSNALNDLKKKRKQKQKEDNREPLDDEIIEERRLNRQKNALARQAKIRSELYIHASDDETDEEGDEEFFRLEEQRRKDQAVRIKKALLLGAMEDPENQTGRKKSGQKRKTVQSAGNADERKRRRPSPQAESDDDDDILMTGVDRPLSRESPNHEQDDDSDLDDDFAFSRDRQKSASPNHSIHSSGANADGNQDEDEEPVTAPSRRRMRAGFVVDSDSE